MEKLVAPSRCDAKSSPGRYGGSPDLAGKKILPDLGWQPVKRWYKSVRWNSDAFGIPNPR